MEIEEQYEGLTKKLKNSLPFTAKPTRELVVELRGKVQSLTLKTTLTVKDVYNSGDISGIVCEIDDNLDEALVCGLTHLIIPSSNPCYKEIVKYQKKRAKRIQQLNRRGVNKKSCEK